LIKAQAELASETSKLDDVQISFSDARSNLVSKINDAYTKSDDAVRNYSGQFFSGAFPSISFKDAIVIGESVIFLNVTANQKISLSAKRTSLSGMLPSWQASIEKINQGEDIEKYISEAKRNLNEVKVFLDELS